MGVAGERGADKGGYASSSQWESSSASSEELPPGGGGGHAPPRGAQGGAGGLKGGYVGGGYVGGGGGGLAAAAGAVQDYPLPHTVRRQCTDALCLLPFALWMLPLAYLRVQGVPGADAQRCRHLLDYRGRLCGTGNQTEKRLLFFCLTEDGQLDLEHPICRPGCPLGGDTEYACVVNNASDGNRTAAVQRRDYATTRIAGVLCLPGNETLAKQALAGRSGMPTTGVLMYIRMGMEAWQPLLASGLGAVLASYGYIYMLGVCARAMVWMGITLMSVVPLGYGCLVLYCWHYRNLCWLTGAEDMEESQKLLIGSTCALVGLLFACFLLRQNDDIAMAIECIEKAVKCIMETPTLLLNPLCILLLRAGLVAALYETGVEILSLFNFDIVTFTTRVEPMVAVIALYFLVSVFWLMHVITAHTQFAIVYSTELWYFHGGIHGRSRAPRCLTLRGYLTALRYHPGSLVLGAAATGFAQPFRLALGAITGLARMSENPVGAVVGAACCCFVSLYEGFLQPLSRNAYLEVAMSSLRFFPAAFYTQEVMNEDDVVHLLNGATWLFQLAGVGSISAFGFILTQLLTVRGFFGFDSFMVPNEDDFVYNVGVESGFGLLIAGAVAFPFMMLFDVISDTVLYCITTDTLRREVEEEEEETWMDGFRRQLGDLVGCTCSLRPKSFGQVDDGSPAPEFQQQPSQPGGAAPGRAALDYQELPELGMTQRGEAAKRLTAPGGGRGGGGKGSGRRREG